MKKILLSFALLACTFGVQAQGTLQFSATLSGTDEVPPNNDPTVAIGTFSLNGNVFNFFLDVPVITFIAQNAYIQGPALPGINAPIIFDLGGPSFRPGNDFGTPPGYRFFSPAVYPLGAGPFILTDEQIAQLENGLWYVNVTAVNYPDGIIRGQILAVPEPSGFVCLVLGGAILTAFGLRRRHCGNLIILLAVSLMTLPSAWAQPACADCPPNHGSFTLTVPPGWSLIASPLFHYRGATEMSAVLDNSVGELFKHVPSGTRLAKFDNATQQFTATIFHGNHWTNPSQTLLPGEGAFIFNPKRESFEVTLTGNCDYGGVLVPIGLSLISSPACGAINFAPLVWPTEECKTFVVTFQDGVITNTVISIPCPPGLGWDSLSFNTQEGDEVYTFSASQGFKTHTFRNGAWDSLPVVGIGEACFVRTTVSRSIQYTGIVPY